jgi:predicted transposase/invertase (TIGR01784 family)
MKRTKQEVREILEAAGLYDDLLQEGWQKGLIEGKKSDARAMKAAGMDTNTIVQITGLTAREILSL